jgi:hypothetical protein
MSLSVSHQQPCAPTGPCFTVNHEFDLDPVPVHVPVSFNLTVSAPDCDSEQPIRVPDTVMDTSNITQTDTKCEITVTPSSGPVTRSSCPPSPSLSATSSVAGDIDEQFVLDTNLRPLPRVDYARVLSSSPRRRRRHSSSNKKRSHKQQLRALAVREFRASQESETDLAHIAMVDAKRRALRKRLVELECVRPVTRSMTRNSTRYRLMPSSV